MIIFNNNMSCEGQGVEQAFSFLVNHGYELILPDSETTQLVRRVDAGKLYPRFHCVIPLDECPIRGLDLHLDVRKHHAYIARQNYRELAIGELKRLTVSLVATDGIDPSLSRLLLGRFNYLQLFGVAELLNINTQNAQGFDPQHNKYKREKLWKREI